MCVHACMEVRACMKCVCACMHRLLVSIFLSAVCVIVKE